MEDPAQPGLGDSVGMAPTVPGAGIIQRAVPNRRPKLEIVAPSASPEEAAAVVAAVERFLRDTARLPAPAAPPPNPWVRAARLEAVDRHPGQRFLGVVSISAARRSTSR